MNQQHKNIKFTIELENKKQLPFLDTKVRRQQNNLNTTLYHKPTFTGVYLNWTSLTTKKYKINLIYCLCDRICKICQRQEDKDLEFEKLKQTLLKNEYPDHIIDKEISKFIKNRNDSSNENNNMPNVEKENSQPKQKY